MYIVNDNKYICGTMNVCATCKAVADGRLLWVKAKIPNGDTVLECPYCETTVAMPDINVKYDANNKAK